MTPFEVLGLPASPQVTDDEVRSAWRRIAAATHPDRADGGNPAAFAEAAAAYSALRTPSGRGEALADFRGPADGGVPDYPVPGRKNPLARLLLTTALRMRRGRPVRLAFRLLAVVATSAVAVAAIGWQPASLAIMAGALTWLLCTGRSDLAALAPSTAARSGSHFATGAGSCLLDGIALRVAFRPGRHQTSAPRPGERDV